MHRKEPSDPSEDHVHLCTVWAGARGIGGVRGGGEPPVIEAEHVEVPAHVDLDVLYEEGVMGAGRRRPNPGLEWSAIGATT